MMATRVGGADRRRTDLDWGFGLGVDADGRRDVDRLSEVTEEGMASCSSIGKKPNLVSRISYFVKREAEAGRRPE